MPSPPPENGKHIVADGEWVGSIAIGYGYADWENDVWKHSSNSALREKRIDPHVLLPGDELGIPPFEPKQEKCATTKKHTFKLKTPTETLRMRFLDSNGDPLKDADYVLNVRHGSGGGQFKQKGKKLNSDGMFEEQIPSTATGATLSIPSLDQEFELSLGYLEPLGGPDDEHTIRGVKQRMQTVGYYDGEIDDEKSPQFESALAAFQKRASELKEEGKDLPEPDNFEGKLTEETIELIKKHFGC